MDKASVNALVLMRIEKFKKDVTESIEGIFESFDNPVSRAEVICDFISCLNIGLEEILHED